MLQFWNRLDASKRLVCLHEQGKYKSRCISIMSVRIGCRMLSGRNKIRSDWSDKDPDWEENFYILQKTKCPAVLTENFFQDNKEDVEFLLSADGKARIVKAHAIGIANYLKV